VFLFLLLVAAVVKQLVHFQVIQEHFRVEEAVMDSLYLLQELQYIMEPGGQEGHQAKSQLLFQEDLPEVEQVDTE
jgi:hypothetical protein